MIELNKNLVQNFDIDTNYITPPIDFIVNLKTEGVYEGEVFINERFHSKLQILCNVNSPDFQLDIELSKLKENQTNKFSILPDGYLVFFLSEGEEYYHIQLMKDDTIIFDNRSLQGNELLALTLVTPGKYICVNENPISTMKILVEEIVGDEYEETEPIEILITENGFSKSQIVIESAQAILFSLYKNCRLKITPENESELNKMNNSWTGALMNIKKENNKA